MKYLVEGINDMKSDICGAVSRAKLAEEPYPHFYMENIFTDDTYKQLLRSLPDPDLYKEFYHKDSAKSDGSATRFRFLMTRSNIAKLPAESCEFWEYLMQELYSPALMQKTFKKLEKGILTRFKSCDSVPAAPSVFLFRDITGYCIRPHEDKFKKVVTTQFYLPEDDDHTHLGTVTHKKSDGKLIRAKQFEFRRNAGYSFAVTNHSWHSVDEITEPGTIRNTLMVAYYVRGGIWNKKRWGVDGRYIPE